MSFNLGAVEKSIVLRFVPLNAFDPISSSELGRLTDARAAFSNAPSSIVTTLSGSVNVSNSVKRNMLDVMIVTPSSTVTSVSDLQLLNTVEPYSTPAITVTEVKPLPLNASCPTYFKVSGIDTVLRFAVLINA